jgi:hypothetical protein
MGGEPKKQGASRALGCFAKQNASLKIRMDADFQHGDFAKPRSGVGFELCYAQLKT